MSNLEIERRFLLIDDSWTNAEIQLTQRIIQSYVELKDGNCERMRVTEGFGFSSATHTVKQRISDITRTETETVVPVIDAIGWLVNAPNSMIDKTRHMIEQLDDGIVWEIDVFHGSNHGLVIAEVELKSETQEFTLPPWIGQDITSDYKYTNLQLSLMPYKHWNP